MTDDTPAEGPATVTLTDDERRSLIAHVWGKGISADATMLTRMLAPAVESIVAARVGALTADLAAATEATMRALDQRDQANARRISAQNELVRIDHDNCGCVSVNIP